MMPPKSAAERMRAYRLKMSEDKKKEAREKNKQSQQICRLKWNDKRRKEESFRGQLRKDKSRKLKKEGKLIVKITTPTKAFGSRQSYGRALAKVHKYLPSSPKKKTAVVTSLATKFGLLTPSPKQKTTVPSENHQKIIDFYNSDLVSWQMPGKKDFVSLKTNELKQKVQKKVMLMTVREAHSIFKSENNIKVGKSTFAKLRPKNILPISERDQNVCCCIYHENFELLCEGMRKSQDIPDRRALLDGIVCEKDKVKCSLGECKTCKDISKYLTKEVFDNSIDEDTQCSFLQWVEKAKKEKVGMPFSDAKEEFTRQLFYLRKHSFIARNEH